jgi:predicted amino acid dehydrogenase
VPPITLGAATLTDAPDTVAGWIILVPLSARQMLEQRRERVVSKIVAAVDHAVELGADIVGLGALTAPITKGGQKLTHRTDIGVTNGNAFTAAITCTAIEQLIGRCPTRDPHIAIVGATGSVGSCVVKLLARRRTVSRLTLVARTVRRLDALAASIRATTPGLDVQTTGDLLKLREADLVVLLTSSADAVLRSEHLKEGAVVLDDTQPRNTSPTLAVERPDVLVVDGGLVSVPGLNLGVNLDLPPNCAYACLAETALLALEGQRQQFSIGDPTVEQAEYLVELAEKHQQFGFTLAPFHTFGRPIVAESAAPVYSLPSIPALGLATREEGAMA